MRSDKSAGEKIEAQQPDDGAEPEPKRGRRRKLLLAGALAALLLGGGGGGAAFLLGVFDGEAEVATSGPEQAAATAPPPADPVFHPLPDMVVTLNAAERKPRYLKVRVTLALDSATDAAQVDKVAPRIIDFCQIYLRELRPEELRGSAGMIRMREELLRRVNAAIAPAVAREVLFTDVFVE